MINFPYFQHYVVKLIFSKEAELDEKFIDNMSDLLIKTLKLKVVHQGKHEFSNNGLTKFWVLSQSHLVVHSWPENSAVHIDLMTCSSPTIAAETIKKCFSPLNPKNIVVTKLEY